MYDVVDSFSKYMTKVEFKNPEGNYSGNEHQIRIVQILTGKTNGKIYIYTREFSNNSYGCDGQKIKEMKIKQAIKLYESKI